MGEQWFNPSQNVIQYLQGAPIGSLGSKFLNHDKKLTALNRVCVASLFTTDSNDFPSALIRPWSR
jgi:hypothetical protein